MFYNAACKVVRELMSYFWSPYNKTNFYFAIVSLLRILRS